jgi:hypothetical protein
MSNDAKDPDLDEFRIFLDRANLSEEDKMFVLASYWSLSDVPPIQSEADYDRCRRMDMAINSPDVRADPEALQAWSESHAGKLTAALRKRIVEWEEGMVGAREVRSRD